MPPGPSRAETESGRKSSLFLQFRKMLGTCGSEFSADVVNDDAHDENAREQIKEHADLDEKRQRFKQQNAEQENSVLQEQVTKHLHDCLVARRQHEEAGPHRRE